MNFLDKFASNDNATAVLKDSELVLDSVITLVEHQIEGQEQLNVIHLATAQNRKRRNISECDDSEENDVSPKRACNLLSTSPVKEFAEARKNVKCWSCKINIAKYKCPRCSIRTCSVACVKHHKKLIDCNGIRYRTGFVSKADFNENNLLGDYRFLEEINQKLRPSAQDENVIGSMYKFSNGKKMQIKQARSMGIELQMMPNNMSRKKMNTTFFNKGKNQFLWHVEWIFSSQDKIVHHDRRVMDSTPLKEAVKKFISVKEGSRFDCRLSAFMDISQDVKFFLKKQPCPANKILYYQLDGEKGLRYNLKGKTIIEFPTVYVAVPNTFCHYPLFISVV